MGKIVRGVLKIAAIAVQFVPGIGQLAAAAITIGLSLLNAALAPKSPKVSASQRDRLYATIDPSTPRKSVMGGTAMATDIRYEEWGGSDQEYLDRIIACASHKVQAIDEIWIEDKLAWTATGGVQGSYVGYLTVATRLEGTSANTIAINGGSKWGSSRRLTGCAYVHMRFKTTGNSKKAESPFASSIPQRLTIRGKGALVYDPRKDSTAGGSGTQRANDQTTWAWVSDDVGNNPALQILWYLLGWRINGKLAVGRGIPPARIDLASFIAAANLCDENVTLAAGGTEKRYRSAGVISEADAATSVLEALIATCAGTIRDAGGRLSLSVMYNDLSAPVMTFTDDDIIDAFDWQQTKGIAFNEVRGRFTDPSNNALYQLVDYPAVRITPADGMERPHPFDLSMVQSASQAQRLAKQELQRAQYAGVFQAEFKARAWGCAVGQPVRLTFSPLGFVNKLFRVTEQVIRMDGICPMVLREENAAIHAWSAEEVAAVQAAAPTIYDPLNSPLIQGIEQANQYIDGTPIDALKPADPGATNNQPMDELQKNASFEAAPDPSGELPGWTEEGLSPGQQLTRFAIAGGRGTYSGLLTGKEAIHGDRFPVVPGETLWYTLRSAINRGRGGTSSPGDNSAIFASIRFYSAAGTFISDAAIINDAARAPGGFTVYSNAATIPANARYAGTYWVQDWTYGSSLTQSYIDEFDVARHEFVADVTRDFDAPQQVIINCDETGTPYPGQLPRPVQIRLLEGTTNVTAVASWADPVVRVGAISASMTTGMLQISSIGADSELRISATYMGKTRSCIMQIFRVIADPVRTANSARDNSISSVSSTSMIVVSDEMEVSPGPIGNINVNFNVSFLTDLVEARTRYMAAILQRWNGSAWVDIDTETIAQYPTTVAFDPDSGIYQTTQNGVCAIYKALTGESAPVKLRVRARVQSGAGNLFPYGYFSMEGV